MAVEADVCPVSQVRLLKPPRVYLWSQTHKLLRVSALKHASFSALAWELRVCVYVCCRDGLGAVALLTVDDLQQLCSDNARRCG